MQRATVVIRSVGDALIDPLKSEQMGLLLTCMVAAGMVSPGLDEKIFQLYVYVYFAS